MCQSSAHKPKEGTNLFLCLNKVYILYSFVCDGKIDCPNDNQDEKLWFCTQIHQNHSTQTSKYKSYTEGNNCPLLHYTQINGQCSYYNTVVNKERPTLQSRTCLEIISDTKYLSDTYLATCGMAFVDIAEFSEDFLKTGSYFQCNTSLLLSLSLLDDLITDCPGHSDEPELYHFLNNYAPGQVCLDPTEVPCFKGHSKCFNISETCKYKLNKQNHIIPCRSGGHLENCKHYQCNALFKCTESYCILFVLVCDGKWDCPQGEDELQSMFCENNQNCVEKYKCQHTKQNCLHLDNVCDSSVDCPQMDDELLCELHNVTCPESCQCLMYAIKCPQLEQSDTNQNFPHVFVSVSSSIILNVITQAFQRAIFLHISSQKVLSVCNANLPRNILNLHISSSLVQALTFNCFLSTKSIVKLSVDNNRITQVKNRAVLNLTQLKLLNLSYNPLTHLEENFIKNSPDFKYLEIVEANLKSIDINALQGLEKNVIISGQHVLCCLALKQAVCKANRPWFVSCEALLPNTELKVMFITMPVFVFVFNLLSFVAHSITKQLGDPFVIQVKFTNMFSSFLVFYLTVIWAIDNRHKDSFSTYEQLWRSSVLCFIAFGALTWFVLLIPLSLMLLSLSRLMIVLHPMDSKFKRKSCVTKYLVVLFLMTFIFNCVITMGISFIEGKLPFVLCSAFVDPTHQNLWIDCIVWFSFVVQFITSAVVLIMHVLLVFQVKKCQTNVTKSIPNQSSIALIVQLALSTMSNFLCWIPPGVIHITLLFLSHYPTELVFWTTVTGQPLHSVIHSGILIIACLKNS